MQFHPTFSSSIVLIYVTAGAYLLCCDADDRIFRTAKPYLAEIEPVILSIEFNEFFSLKDVKGHEASLIGHQLCIQAMCVGLSMSFGRRIGVWIYLK